MVNLFNLTNVAISDYVNGAFVEVPAKGSTQTTEKKAKVLMKKFLMLSLAPKPDYTPAEYAGVQKLTKGQLVEVCRAFMVGGKVDFAEFGVGKGDGEDEVLLPADDNPGIDDDQDGSGDSGE